MANVFCSFICTIFKLCVSQEDYFLKVLIRFHHNVFLGVIFINSGWEKLPNLTAEHLIISPIECIFCVRSGIQQTESNNSVDLELCFCNPIH